MTRETTIGSCLEADRFRDYAATLEEPDWMRRLRRDAYDRFARMEWPTPQEEEWRRSDVCALDLESFAVSPPILSGGRAPEDPRDGAWDGVSGHLRFDRSSGTPNSTFLDADLLRRGVVFGSLSEGIAERVEPVASRFRDALDEMNNRFQALHYSFWTHGALLFIPAGLELEKPFVIDLRETRAGALSCPHLFVVVERGASVTVIQRIAGAGDAPVLVNAGLHLDVGENAGLTCVETQDLNRASHYFHHGRAFVARDGRLSHFAAHLGGRFAKTRLECSLEGPGAEAHLRGLYLSSGEGHKDLRTVQRHSAPHARSEAHYKGAVRDRGRTIFQGLIEVTPDATKTDAYLSNKNLILNDGARADSIPSLEIQTDDVRCTHGSTTGRINEEEVFYLMSRGFPRREAERLVILAFFEDLLADAPASVREDLRRRIEEEVIGG